MPLLHFVRNLLRDSAVATWVRRHPKLYTLAVRVWLRLNQFVAGLDPRLALSLPWLGAQVAAVWLVRPKPRPLDAREVPRIVMLTISEVFRDPRIEREARALAAAGFRVTVLYPDYFSEPFGVAPLDWGPNIEFHPLPGNFASYARAFPFVIGFRFLREALREQAFAFHAHDATTALIALAAARRARAHCVCDFHEWFSENVSWDASAHAYVAHSAMVRTIFRAVERVALRRASAVVTVCESIATELTKMSGNGRPVVVVRNIPAMERVAAPSTTSLRDSLGLPADRMIVLYQGGVGPARMLEPVIRAMRMVPTAALVIRGPGIDVYGDGYLRLAAECAVADRVFCLPPVPSSAVVAAGAEADCGIWTLPDLCKNFRYALPNKVFEYLAAGIALAAADYPEVRRIVDRYDVGVTFDPYDPESIAAALNGLALDPVSRRRCAANAAHALEDMEASREWDKLVAMYRGLADGRPAALASASGASMTAPRG